MFAELQAIKEEYSKHKAALTKLDNVYGNLKAPDDAYYAKRMKILKCICKSEERYHSLKSSFHVESRNPVSSRPVESRNPVSSRPVESRTPVTTCHGESRIPVSSRHVESPRIEISEEEQIRQEIVEGEMLLRKTIDMFDDARNMIISGAIGDVTYQKHYDDNLAIADKLRAKNARSKAKLAALTRK